MKQSKLIISPPKTMEELKQRADKTLGVLFLEIDINKQLNEGKGSIGTFIEERVFGQKPHNDHFPDFKDLNVELKVTPYIKKSKNNHFVYKAKERLVCNMIDYSQEYKYNNFEQSSFYKKCSNLLLLFYEHKPNVLKSHFKISYSEFLTFNRLMKQNHNFYILLPDKDIKIIKQDWRNIIQKIKDGKADQISEGDTNYLGACTKASDSSVRVLQPFSNIKAKPKAFSLKQSYMTYILNNYVLSKNQNKSEEIISSNDDLMNKTFEDIIIERFEPYYEKSEIELANLFNINIKNKGFRSKIISSILKIKSDVNFSEEFQKAFIISKAIRVEQNNKIKESISFPKIDFKNLVNEDWLDSVFYQQIGLSRFMFCIFKKENKEYIFKKVKFWNMPISDLNQAKQVWGQTKDLIVKNKLIFDNFSVKNFPKSSENPVSHVRPHDIDAKKGRTELSNGRKIINYCFWINRKYIQNIINEILKN